MTTFDEQMKALLGEEYIYFYQESKNPPHHGLRFNRLKGNPDELKNLVPYVHQPVLWCSEGYYYPPDERPAKSLAYHAGLFYIQEPSAMLPVAVLDARPGDKVLDLCAAPGGKSVQLSGQLCGQGVLVANDASASRSRALVRNLELAGVTNACVLNEQPNRLAGYFPAFFDRILVDAPCSGEGMFRRDVDAAKAWGENKPAVCAAMQREILRHAAAMLKPGGRLVYSTCTFNKQENEEQINHFLNEHDDFFAVPVDHKNLNISPGMEPLPEAGRIWPHHCAGEGHFVALLEKKKNGQLNEIKTDKTSLPRSAKTVFDFFCREHITAQINNSFFLHERSLYLIPEGMPLLRGLRVSRSGWYLGEVSKDRFTPSQAFAMGLEIKKTRYSLNLTQHEAVSYIKGNTFIPEQTVKTENDKPWVLLCYENHPIGWGRMINGRLKNQLPVAWVMR